MPSNRPLRITLMSGVVLAILAGFFWLIGVTWAPTWIKKQIEGYSQQLGYSIQIQSIDVKPFQLVVQVQGLRLDQIQGKQLFGLDAGLIRLRWSKLITGELGVQDLQLTNPSILLERAAGAGSKWNWMQLIETINAQKPPSTEAKPKAIEVSVDRLAIQGARLQFRDGQTKFADDLGPFSLNLRQLSNYRQASDEPGVEGLYELDLGKVDLLIPSLNKMVIFEKVQASGGVNSPEPDQLEAKLNLKLDAGVLDFFFHLEPKQNLIKIDVAIDNLSVAPMITLLPANNPLQTNSGVMAGKLQYQTRQGLWSTSGDLSLKNFEITEGKPRQAFMKWHQADFKQIDLRRLASGKTSLTIDEILFDQPDFKYDLDEQGFSNIRRMFAKPVSTTTPSAGPAEEKSANFELDIKALKLRNGIVHFADLGVVPQLQTDIRKLNGSLLGVSNVPGRYAAIALDGLIADRGSFRAKGQAAFDDPRRNHDVLFEFKNVPLKTANAYFMKYAGYPIQDGRLDLMLNYKAKDAELVGQNRFVIKDIELGEEVPNFQGRRLPLRLAIALLEDSDNVIDISLGIKGNVDSPEFSATGLVWQAIRTVLTNIVTAPFRALASLLGLQSDAPIHAVLGESSYLPVDQEKLDKLAGVLVKRPNATIEFVGVYDPSADKAALARARADRAILNAAGFKLSPQEPLPIPSLSDPRVQAGVRSAYGQQVGRIQLAQRLISLPDNEARYQQLRNELIQSYAISEAELMQLASARANRAKELMVAQQPNLAERITIGTSKAGGADQDGIPLGVSLGSKK
ncbi:DUF748 domain-containing protein [Polynucleobacter sp. HIN8]|uniref:DUF748 domain-containing protein n=1 Tax=Polynucleobacter sp. HIN8 TaxID=3047867 RepID=UPI0025738F97|nr:DUF748 domain-containing protein [Polynucleobacter sp. HIN8]